jgi:SAM-dependent methyltransferase
MKAERDAYGKQLLAQYEGREPTAEIIEREDGYFDTGADPGAYFAAYDEWPPTERRAIRYARGRVLDIGCGAGRHALYLQSKGLDVTGIDNSPGAIKVCRLRGLKRALVRPIADVDKFKPGSFDTVLMLGNNFGLFGSAAGAQRSLRKLAQITSEEAVIIAGTRDPHLTTEADHLRYQRHNKERGRMAGQIRLRVRFGKSVGEWFDYLLVSPKEMESILQGSAWEIDRLIGSGEASYFAVIRKRRKGRTKHDR